MLDSRELIEERDELKNQVVSAYNEEFGTDYSSLEYDEVIELFDDESDFDEAWIDEMNKIREISELEDEVSSLEWDYGITFIPEDEFEGYCEELVKDCGMIPRDTPLLIYNNIDWSGIAFDVKQDYSEVEFQGEKYLFRS